MNSKSFSVHDFLQKLEPVIGYVVFANYSESYGVLNISYWGNYTGIPVLKDLKITRSKMMEMYGEL